MSKTFMVRPSWGERIQFILLGPRDLLLWLVCSRFCIFTWVFGWLPPWYIAWASRSRARRAFYRAVRSVPAYRQFLAEREADSENVPETDKESYIRVFPTEARCLNGRLPPNDVMIDESSGSTGTPYNWVRTARERLFSHLFVSYFCTYCFGSQQRITINAFSMGAWATGLNMGLALQRNTIVKNTGPDLQKIFHTLSFFGSQYPYLIVGYPPFLKQFIDVAESQRFPLADYRLDALVGGEGMSEGLREYLLRHFDKVYSGYGATDLEIGIAGESPLSVAIRRLARDDAAVRRRLFGADCRLPMVFQYNPLTHHIAVNENREVVFTITRSSVLSPRIRYNIHDEGGIARYDEMAEALDSTGHDIRQLVRETGRRAIQLPFLWIYGRRDFTISVMGANIYPEDLEYCVYADPELARMTRSFCQTLWEGPDGEVRPRFFFEVDAEPSDELAKRFSESILRNLVELNADFREAWHEYPETMVPQVHLHRVGEGPFARDAERIKQTRLLRPCGTPAG